MKTVLLILLIALGPAVFGQEQVKSTPSWYKNPPKNEVNKLYGAGQGWSVRMNIAEQKATMAAIESIAKQINPPKKTKKYFYLFPKKNNSSASVKTTLESEEFQAQIKNSVVVKKAFKKHKDGYLVYILIAADKSN
jgi:hypothetical protein